MTAIEDFIRARLGTDKQRAIDAGGARWSVHLGRPGLRNDAGPIDEIHQVLVKKPGDYAHVIRLSVAADARHIARQDPARTLDDVEAKLAILDEHEPVWRVVEWPHDQDGKGNALVCPRCQNADHSTWNPPVGHADVLPEGFVTPYVLAPCQTVRLLALPYTSAEGYDPSWKPA